MIKLIIIGASTPTIIRTIDDINIVKKQIEIVGFVDNNFKELGNNFFGYEILGNFEKVTNYNKDQIYLINKIASSTALRKEITDHFINLEYKFTNIIHPSVNLKHVEIG